MCRPTYNLLMGIRSIFVASVIVFVACGSDPRSVETVSPSAKLGTVEMLIQDIEEPRHPADGQGKAWVDESTVDPTAGGRGSFSVVFETGPEGIAEGGAVYFMPSPFWGWSAPQNFDPEGLGYCQVSTDAVGVELSVISSEQMVIASIVGRALELGERLVFAYGVGSAGAAVDRFAEHDSRLWVAVDGDGDGVRKVLEESPGVDIGAGDPARLHMALPGVARPGERVRLTIAVLDVLGNAGLSFDGDVTLESEVSLSGIQSPVHFRIEDRGRKTVELVAPDSGVVRVRGHSGQRLSGESNPMRVSSDGPRTFWADLHGHSGLSDGTGTPEDYFSYARDVAALDVVALTDHDHWGVVFLDQSPDMWSKIREQGESFHQPGRFVTLLGYEWTSWLHGHRHVLFFEGEGEVFSSIDPRYDTPPELWAALKGQKAMTIAHHTAGGPVATNWDYAPDPVLEPVTEVVSVHGSSEAEDSPQLIYSPVAGNFARDALLRGYRLGFVGSGDGHDGHPGLSHLASGTGGLAGIMADELTKESVMNAIRRRRVFATNGPRILVRMAVDGHPMGSKIELTGNSATVFVSVSGTAPIEKIEVIRNDEIVASVSGQGELDAQITLLLADLNAGDFAYTRIFQVDGGGAWTSPVFFEKTKVNK